MIKIDVLFEEEFPFAEVVAKEPQYQMARKKQLAAQMLTDAIKAEARARSAF